MAYKVILNKIQELELKDIVKNNKANPNLLKRAYCILLKNEGQQNENIVRLLGIHEDSIADWTKIFLKKGISGLMKFKYSERRKSKLKPHIKEIRRIASTKSVTTVKQLQKKIKTKFDIDIEYSWLYRYCVKNKVYDKLKSK